MCTEIEEQAREQRASWQVHSTIFGQLRSTKAHSQMSVIHEGTMHIGKHKIKGVQNTR